MHVEDVKGAKAGIRKTCGRVKNREKVLLGQRGEEAACRYLKKQGYNIVARNYRCRSGEIDVIAIIENQIVFVEVKTRHSLHFGSPAEAVSKEKMRHLIICTECFFTFYKQYADLQRRIDVIEILVKDDNRIYINHLKNITG